MGQTGVVIVVHGSRGEQGSTEVPRVMQRVTDGVKALLSPGVEVIGAALQFNRPSLEEAVEQMVTQGVSRVMIMPYFLFPGRHITEHIPRLIDGFKRAYPERQFVVANPLGLDKLFLAQVAECIVEVAPELSCALRPSLSPGNIEQQSLDIVERVIPPLPGLSEGERAVVKRIVHASGDPGVARLIRFGPSAISNGLRAIASGSPIFTDVRMVAAGINGPLAGKYGCSLSCAMDESEPTGPAREDTVTRAAAAVHRLEGKLGGAIIAIGNAPTALLALLDLVDKGEKPALVVGMPVGFVQARESKDELMKRQVPYVTVVGTRGGSAMAAATVNALLRIAAEKDGRGKFSP